MADDLCPRCGWVLGSSAAACPACGEPLKRVGSGYDTVFYPEEAAALKADGGPGPGTTLLHEDAAADAGASLPLKRKPFLTCRGSTSSGRRLEVGCPTTTVGREGGDISIDDPALSSLHFMIEERGHEFFLRDLGSTNGTFLNGHPVRSATLESGDEIRAGESEFVFSVLDVIPCG